MKQSPAPKPAHRLIPSQFPPIAVFDTVSTAADLKAVFDVVGWTNDRLVADRVARLDQSEWVYGIPSSSIVMAAFLHVGNDGMRFNGNQLGAWYAAASIRTAIAEVAHHLRRQCFAEGLAELTRVYRAYSCEIAGEYLDIRQGQIEFPKLYAGTDYTHSQPFGENVRRRGENGILYDSLRHAGGENICVFRPKRISNILQTEHYEIRVDITSRKVLAKTLQTSAGGNDERGRD